MNIRVFNVCLLLGWIMVLAGGVVIHPGWGIAIAGGLLIVLTLAAAYIAGWEPPAAKPAENSSAD
jgi:hypothetical protein